MWKKYPENKPKYSGVYYSALYEVDGVIKRCNVCFRGDINGFPLLNDKHKALAFYDNDPSDEFLMELEKEPVQDWYCVCGNRLILQQLVKNGSLYVSLDNRGFYVECVKCYARSSKFSTPAQAYKQIGVLR